VYKRQLPTRLTNALSIPGFFTPPPPPPPSPLAGIQSLVAALSA